MATIKIRREKGVLAYRPTRLKRLVALIVFESSKLEHDPLSIMFEF